MTNEQKEFLLKFAEELKFDEKDFHEEESVIFIANIKEEDGSKIIGVMAGNQVSHVATVCRIMEENPKVDQIIRIASEVSQHPLGRLLMKMESTFKKQNTNQNEGNTETASKQPA